MSKSDGGKGSTPRPYSVTQQEYDSRWDLIFGRDKPKEYSSELTSEMNNSDNFKQQPKETEDE